MITWLESGLYLHGAGSGLKEDWANLEEGQGGGSESTQQAVKINGPFRCHWWGCVGGSQF
jgi:hypothetical protein